MQARRGQLAERGEQRRRVGVETRDELAAAAGARRSKAVQPARKRSPAATPSPASRAADARREEQQPLGAAAPSARRSPGRAWPRSARAARGAGRPPSRIRSMRPRPSAPSPSSQPSSRSLRSGIRIATAVPSAAAPRYGATSGSGSGNGVAAMKPSRSAWSRVERTIQSTAAGRALEDERGSVRRRTSRVSEAPDQPSLGNAASGASASPCSASRSGSVRTRPRCLSTGPGRRPRHPARRRGRRRANPGSCGSARRRAARSSEAFASTWISPAGMYTKSPAVGVERVLERRSGPSV